MTKLNTIAVANAVSEFVALLLARRADADALADQLQSRSAHWRALIDAKTGCLALSIVRDNKTEVIDVVSISPDDPAAGLSLDAWIDAQISASGQITH